ncbi:hypothetical protein NMY22_g19571 [Coprinellus aureogranulatus]|nr:hypothetical protein NMY22_g19571 [Coprinellus aureogranulatus]
MQTGVKGNIAAALSQSPTAVSMSWQLPACLGAVDLVGNAGRMGSLFLLKRDGGLSDKPRAQSDAVCFAITELLPECKPLLNRNTERYDTASAHY